MYIYFQRTILEQTDSILCLNKILGKNCKIQKHITNMFKLCFLEISIETNQNLSDKWIVFKGQMHRIIDWLMIDWLIDWLIDYMGYTPCRQFFGHVTAVQDIKRTLVQHFSRLSCVILLNAWFTNIPIALKRIHVLIMYVILTLYAVQWRSSSSWTTR